ncbi:MAG: hypothetical protein ACTHJI_00140 [Leifsonia sp.]
MSRDIIRTHGEHAQRLRDAVTGSGILDERLRRGALEAGPDGDPLAEPYGALVRQIREDSSRVTDAQVRAVREAAGSEKAAFELVFAAAAEAGLRRWDAAVRAMTEAGDATD